MWRISEFVRGGNGQTVVESSVGLLLLCLVAALTINMYYLISYAHSVLSAAGSGALAIVQGSASAAPGSNSVTTAIDVAASNGANSQLNPAAPLITVTPCLQSTNCGFVDPESGSDSMDHGQFVSNAVTASQSFVEFMRGTLLGQSVIVIAPSQPFSKTVYMRSIPGLTPVTTGTQ